MFRPAFSVIIPARDSENTIETVLKALVGQRQEVKHEVIVVNDGSKDNTANILGKGRRNYGGEYLRVLNTKPRGSAAARNEGSAAARSNLLLFLGADIIPAPGLLKRHLSAHKRWPAEEVGCLGHVTWDPSLPPTAFMNFLEHGGPQNAFDEIAGRRWVPPQHYFYGSNLSLKKNIFEKAGRFNETDFSEYGWEDLELGYRLKRLNFKLYYEPAATGLHRHPVSLTQAEERMKNMGKGAYKLQIMHPDLKVINLDRERRVYLLRKLVFFRPIRAVLRKAASAAEKTKPYPVLYRRLLDLAYYDGVHESFKLNSKRCG